MATLNEDDIWRASTQYKLWSFSAADLASLRVTANAEAAIGVRAAIASQKQMDQHALQLEYLSTEEEQKLVHFYCTKAMELSDFFPFPTNVKATAVQILKRFYIANSPMTYHPKQIMPAAVFLSTKTENHYISLSKFVQDLPRMNAEDVRAPECLIIQAMRYSLDIRHPQRALEGACMELRAMAAGEHGELLKLDMQKIDSKRNTTGKGLIDRINKAYGAAKEMLIRGGLLSDAYFHYTPSQIAVSSLLLADEALAAFFISSKMPLGIADGIAKQLLSTLKSCGRMMKASPPSELGQDEMQELKRIDKKLHSCRNPRTMDLVGLNSAQKRDGEETNGEARVAKKQKLEAEKKGDDIFGSALG